MDPLSPQWWAERLTVKLAARRTVTDRLRLYYSGNHPFPIKDPKVEEKYKDYKQSGRSNWCGLIADSTVERQQINGFRLGQGADADALAWSIWQANSLDAWFDNLLTEKSATGYGYGMVWPTDEGTPAVTIESADQVIVERDPQSRKIIAAAKTWYDDLLARTNVNVFLPNGVYKFYVDPDAKDDSQKYRPRPGDGEAFPLPNPFPSGKIPVVEFLNRPDIAGVPKAEFEDVIDIQDRLNLAILYRTIAVRASAHKQKYATGLEQQFDESGEEIDPTLGADTLLAAEDPNVTFGEFSESNISGYSSVITDDVQHMAAISRTPPHYLLGSAGSFPSGDSLKATETGLVAKVRRRMKHDGENCEELVRLYLELVGVVASLSMSTWWADPESRSISELTDALLKQKALGIPDETAWEGLGYTPEQIKRIIEQQNAANARGLAALSGFDASQAPQDANLAPVDTGAPVAA